MKSTSNSPDDWFTPGRFAIILLVLLCVAYPDVILGKNTFYFRDFGFFGYPLAYYHRESFWHGEIPLWNPLSDCGLPFLAQWNTLVLYPGSIIYLLFPISWSLGIFCLGHLFLAGMGMYWLAYAWTNNRLAASVAGLAFAFNGLSLSFLMWPNNVAALGWMPLVVLSVQRAWLEGGRMIILGALVGAIQMLSGAPEVILLTWVFLALLAATEASLGLASWIPKKSKSWPDRATTATDNQPVFQQIAWRFPLVVLLVVALAAVQLLPFIDLLRHSQRTPNFANADWAMPETGWANFLVPLFHTYQNRQGVHFQYGQYWTSSYYLGIGVFVLAVVAFCLVREKRIWFLGGITFLSLILALGDQGYLYAWLREAIPQFGFMRYPIKFVTLAAFSVPLLAGFAIRFYQELPAENLRAVWKGAGLLLLVFLSLITGIVWFGYHYSLVEEKWVATVKSALSRTAFLLLILGTIVSFRSLKRRESSLLARFGLLFLIASDVLTHAPRQNPTVSRAALEPGLLPLHQFDPQPRHGDSRAMLTPEADMKLRYAFTSNPLNDYLCSRLGLFSNCNLLDGIPKLNGFYSLYLREAAEVISMIYTTTNSPPSGLYDFLGVSQITRPGEYFEWTNRTSYLPLATVGQKPLFADEAAILASIQETNFNPRQVVYLTLEAKPYITATNQSGAEVLRARSSAHQIDLVVQTPSPTLLIVAQAFYHPWHAYVDGQNERIWRANDGFQAIQIPAGQHNVRFAYQDKQFLRGAVISGMTFVFCVLFWAGSRFFGLKGVEASATGENG